MTPRTRVPLDPIPAHLADVADLEPFGHYVYFAQDSGSPLVKIGTTYRPRLMQRMRDLERMIGRPVGLLALVVGDHKVERTYHASLREYRAHGEWFYPSPAVQAAIQAAGGSLMPPDAAAYWHEWAALL